MKTTLASLIFSLTTLTSIAQANSGSPKKVSNDSFSQLISEFKNKGLAHFTFKDIPIDGSLSQFVAQLKKQNFIVLKTTDIDAVLTGRFTGEEVRLLVQATPTKVYGVTVVYNEQSSWKSIKIQYENVKFKLTEKYGEPREVVEKFDDLRSEKFGLELHALKEDKCTYRAHFLTDTGNGIIRLKITNDAGIAINYVVALNLLIANREYNEY